MQTPNGEVDSSYPVIFNNAPDPAAVAAAKNADVVIAVIEIADSASKRRGDAS